MLTPTKDLRARLEAQHRLLVFKGSAHGERGSKEYKEAEQAITARQGVAIDAAKQGVDEFASYLREMLEIEPTEELGTPDLPRSLTSSEFIDPPLGVERELGSMLLPLVTAREASQPLVWTLLHIGWLEAGSLGNDPYASFFCSPGGKAPPSDDRAMRNALRRLGGLPYARGNVSVFSDCPVARAYWRYRVAADVAANSAGLFTSEEAHAALHASNEGWDQFAMVPLRRFPAISESRARAALVTPFLDVTRERNKPSAKAATRKIQAAGQALGQVAVVRSLKHTQFEELREVVDANS